MVSCPLLSVRWATRISLGRGHWADRLAAGTHSVGALAFLVPLPSVLFFRSPPVMRDARAAKRIQSADTASRMLILETPARRFSNRIGVSPIRQPTVLHQ